MNVHPINDSTNPISVKGLYFTKNSAPIKKTSKDTVYSISERGIRYIEDNEMSGWLKSKISEVPFIKNLMERFDVFIHYSEYPRMSEKGLRSSELSKIKVFWARSNNDKAESICAGGASINSMEEAKTKMLSNLRKKNFEVDNPSLQKIFI